MIKNNYKKAKELFLQYNGSYFHMQREMKLNEYLKFKIPKYKERRWLKEKINNLFIEIENTNKINLKYSKYWEIFYILIQIMKNKVLLFEAIKKFEKDLKNLDIYSIVSIIEIIYDDQKIWKNCKKSIKKAIQNANIDKNEIISKEHNKLNGTQFLTEEEVIIWYRKILSKLDI